MSLVSSRIAIGVSAALFAAGANSATLDFTIPTSGFVLQSYIDAVGSTADDYIGGNITSENGYATVVLDVDGEDLNIRIDDVLDGNPYFDADSGGPGGLGSCRTLTSNAQCSPSSDDNLTIATNESLLLEFTNNAGDTQSTGFGEFLFHDDNHNAITGTIRVTHDDGMETIFVTDGIGDLSAIGGSTFLLFNDEADDIKASTNYYISAANVTAVPVPAAVWLFGSGLGILGWMRRKASA
jgi:hypothetical protein